MLFELYGAITSFDTVVCLLLWLFRIILQFFSEAPEIFC